MDRRLFLAGMLNLPLWLASCSREPLLRVMANYWVGYEPMFLAQTLGYYNAEQVRLIESPSNTNILMALASGEADAGTLTLDECLLARSGGLDVRVIALFDTSDGADVVMAHPDIRTLSDLAGKRIGVEETAVGALVLSKTLKAAHLQPKDIIKVPVSGGRTLAYYKSGKVDAVVCYEPFASRLAELGARRLYDSHSFPGVIVDVMVVRGSVVDRQSLAVRALVDGYFRALNFLHADPEVAYKKMAPRMQISPLKVQQALAGIHLFDETENRQWLANSGQHLLTVAKDVGKIMLQNHLLAKMPSLDGLVDAHFLPGSR